MLKVKKTNNGDRKMEMQVVENLKKFIEKVILENGMILSVDTSKMTGINKFLFMDVDGSKISISTAIETEIDFAKRKIRNGNKKQLTDDQYNALKEITNLELDLMEKGVIAE